MGENLYSSSSVDGTKASESWYSEVKNYNYNNPGFGMNTGHFTQLVWKSTTKIGCGAACNNSGFCAVVCNYYPGGNFGGTDDYAKNVLELKEGMSGVAIFFLVFFIIILLAVGGFAVYHFLIKKKSFGDLKEYWEYIKNWFSNCFSKCFPKKE